MKSGKFQILSPQEILFETRKMAENIEIDDCIFTSNYASNYISLRGTLSKDKYEIIDQINEGLKKSGLNEKDLYRRL